MVGGCSMRCSTMDVLTASCGSLPFPSITITGETDCAEGVFASVSMAFAVVSSAILSSVSTDLKAAFFSVDSSD